MKRSKIKAWMNDQTQATLDQFKRELAKRLEPVVVALVAKLRERERAQPGLGIQEIEDMLAMGDINQSMYDILRPALENLDTEFKFELTTTKKNSEEPTKLG